LRDENAGIRFSLEGTKSRCRKQLLSGLATLLLALCSPALVMPFQMIFAALNLCVGLVVLSRQGKEGLIYEIDKILLMYFYPTPDGNAAILSDTY